MQLSKLNSSGVLQWTAQIIEGAVSLEATSVATDTNENVIVTGYLQGTVNFGGGNLTSAGGPDIFVAKFNSGGVHQWSQRFGDVSSQHAFSVATDASGNVIVAGYFQGTVNFGGGNLTSAGFEDIFVVKFNAGGVHQWSQRFGDSSRQNAYSVATDASGNVIVTGGFVGMVNFGGGTLTSAGSEDVFVAKFNGVGVHRWSQHFGDANSQIANSVATHASGNVVV